MTMQGTIVNGVIVLDNGASLPDGTRVDVHVQEKPEPGPSLAEVLLQHAGKAHGLPVDAAAQHDHYLYRTPKR